MSDKPSTEILLENGNRFRVFSESVDTSELVWHQDREDRRVKVIESNGWMLQMDNELPVLLKEGTIYNIPAYEFHRVIKGKGTLKVLVEKNEVIT